MSGMRDQAVRVAFHIPAHVVARMAGVAKPTIVIYELDPLAVRDDRKRARIASVYDELRGMLTKYPAIAA